MRTLSRSLLCILCLASSLAAQIGPVDTTPIARFAQDSTGRVWGAGSATGSSMFRWEGDKWNRVFDAGTAGVVGNPSMVTMTTGPDGAVYCLWINREGPHAVTWHKGSASKTLAQFSGDLGNMPNIFVDPNRNVWITGQGLHIYRITPEGKAESVYTIEYDHRYDANVSPGSSLSLNFATIHATADGQGRVWFWAGLPAGGVPTLDGILIFDGKKFDLHSDFPGPPNHRYASVASDGPDHMWVVGMQDHLYRVDIHTLIAEVVPEPAPNAFRWAQRIFHAGQATYVLSIEGALPVAESNGEGRIGAVWRRQGGEWKRVLNGIDMRPRAFNDPPRSFAETAARLWVGAYGTGPWLIPAAPGQPIHIDWKYGFSLEDSESLAALPDGRLLVMVPDQAATTFNPRALLASHPSPAGVETLNPLRTLVSDRNHHLWGFLSGELRVISEWDGKTWTAHALPENFDPRRIWNFGLDSQDRIWLHPGCQGVVYVFDPRSGKTATYPDFSAALQAQLPDHATFNLHGEHLTIPTFTPDGRIGYRDGCSQAHYFDGRSWQSWRAQDIDTARRGGFEGPAFFDRAGNFAVNLMGRTWEYSAAEGWHITTYEKGPGTDQGGQPPDSHSPPPGCAISHADSMTQDRLGTWWLTSQGQLYRALSGFCVPQFSPEQRQPFRDLRTIKTVLVDPQGNAFLETWFRSHPSVGEYVIVKARPPLPRTQLHAGVDALGMVKLQFGTQVKGKAWFTWRVDGGDWSPPAPLAETTINSLANGKHTIEAAALDARLQIDPTPATAEVTIHVDPQAQLAALIEQLKDPNYDVRNAAVAALVRQPTVALPLLQSAREKADEDQRWWIDAAIQQIKDRAP